MEKLNWAEKSKTYKNDNNIFSRIIHLYNFTPIFFDHLKFLYGF